MCFTNGRQHRRAGGVSADPDHDVGRELAEHAARIPERARQVERGLEPRHQADVLERADAHQLQWISRGGHQPILNAARGSDEEHFGVVALLQLIGDGESGNDMSAGASARQNRAHAVTINYATDRYG